MWRWHRETGVMKYLAVAMGLTLMTCRACAHRFYVKSAPAARDEDEGLRPAQASGDQPVEREWAMAASVGQAAGTPQSTPLTSDDKDAETEPPETPAAQKTLYDGPATAVMTDLLPVQDEAPKPLRKRGVKVKLKIRTRLFGTAS